ncbi:MAG: hypothetical protein U0930_01510 [Pirellulales bacterium]
MKQDPSKPYRCLIPPEDCACRLRVGRKDIVCELIDLSREDFRVRIPRKVERAVRKARRIELRYHGERWLVKLVPNHTEQEPGVYMLIRIDELTPVQMPSPWAALSAMRMSRDTDPRFVLALMLALIFACLSLPGIGDQLGTAPRIKDGLHSVMRSFK